MNIIIAVGCFVLGTILGLVAGWYLAIYMSIQLFKTGLDEVEKNAIKDFR
jgi:hypothetical protein